MRNTKQRQIVLDAVMQSRTHPKAEDIYSVIHAEHPHISRATVYRNLNQLTEMGQIRHIMMPGSSGNRFDWRTDHHSHLVCVECGHICDMEEHAPMADDQYAQEKTGYSHVSHVTVYYGTCPDCQKKQKH